MFKAQRSGRIVNVASMAGWCIPRDEPYNSVKAGVVALSETMLHEPPPTTWAFRRLCELLPDQSRRQPAGSDPGWEPSARKLMTESKLDAATVAARAVEGPTRTIPGAHPC
jgi:hypothetical protein